MLAMPNTVASEDDAALALGWPAIPTRSVFLAMPSIKLRGHRLKALAINDVVPDAANVENNSYPLSGRFFSTCRKAPSPTNLKLPVTSTTTSITSIV